jgi:hypothetical protein
MLGGLGTADRGTYNDPWPLKGWVLVPPHGAFAAQEQLKAFDKSDLWGKEFDSYWKWVKQSPDGKMAWIAEEQLEGLEWELLPRGSEAYKIVQEAS